MAFAHAGRYGADNFFDQGGHLIPAGTVVSVVLPGTNTLVPLYTNRDRTFGITNPTSLGVGGNLTFFAEPGDYDVVFPGSPPITVEVTPAPVDLLDLLDRVTALES
jgi:hypothetical protein